MEEPTIVAVRQRYSAATWKEWIAACRSSGQSVAGWCFTNGINRKSYYRWESKLLGEAGNEPCRIRQTQQTPRFAEIAVIPSVTCPTDVIAVLRMGEITCELHHQINSEQLSAIVQAMKSHA